MTAIRAWNGSAWVQPKYMVGYDQGPLGWPWPNWDSYRDPPAVIPPVSYATSLEEAHITNSSGGDIAAWGFDGDAQGWHDTNLAAPAWRPGALDYWPIDTYGNSQYYYSDDLNLTTGTLIGGWVVLSCSGVDMNAITELRFYVNLYYDGLKALNAIYRLYGPTGPVRLDMPGYAATNGRTAHFQITNMVTKKTAGAAQTIVPKYWNGSAWIPQNSL